MTLGKQILTALDKFIHYFGGAKPQKGITTEDARNLLETYYKEKSK